MYMYEHLVELIRVSAQFSFPSTVRESRDSRLLRESSSRGPLETSLRRRQRIFTVN